MRICESRWIYSLKADIFDPDSTNFFKYKFTFKIINNLLEKNKIMLKDHVNREIRKTILKIRKIKNVSKLLKKYLFSN